MKFIATIVSAALFLSTNAVAVIHIEDQQASNIDGVQSLSVTYLNHLTPPDSETLFNSRRKAPKPDQLHSRNVNDSGALDYFCP